MAPEEYLDDRARIDAQRTVPFIDVNKIDAGVTK